MPSSIPSDQMAKNYCCKPHKRKADGIRNPGRVNPRSGTFLFACLLLLPAIGSANANLWHHADPSLNLPVLSEEESNGTGYVGVDAQRIAVGEDGFANTWEARVEGYQDVRPLLKIEQGRLLTEKLGAGGSYTVGSGYSELVMNGVFAPESDLRVQLTAAQMRSRETFMTLPDQGSQALFQTGYLFDIQKKWGNEDVLSEAGIAVYTASAEEGTARNLRSSMPAAGQYANDGDAGRLATGRLDGYMLNLRLQPTSRSDVTLIYKRENLAYHSGGSSMIMDGHSSGAVNYSQSFRGCSQFDGRFSKGYDMEQVDLHFEKGRWNLNLLRTQANDYRDTSVHVGYSIPLGRSGGNAARCDSEPESAPSFGAVVDAAIDRPQLLPKEPLARIDTSATPESSAE
jgi:hypothetical protein